MVTEKEISSKASLNNNKKRVKGDHFYLKLKHPLLTMYIVLFKTQLTQYSTNSINNYSTAIQYISLKDF